VNRRFFDLDVLRFLAAISVMAMHYLVRGFSPEDRFFTVSYGDVALWFRYNGLAVNLFFTISGFVILMSAGRGDSRGFLISRLTRLYPAYWVCCTLAAVIGATYLQDLLGTTFLRYALNMTMLNGIFGIGYIDGVYWTLLVELKFYALIYFLLLTGSISKIDLAMAIWLAFSAIQIYIRDPAIAEWLSTNYAPFFVLGCTFYKVSVDGYNAQRIVAIAASVVVGAWHEVASLQARSQVFGVEYSPIVVAAIVVGIAAAFAVLIHRTSGPGWYQSLSAHLGVLSYPIYLVHLTLGLAVYRIAAHKVDKWVLFFSLCTGVIALAASIHWFVERPLSGWMKRWLQSRLPTRAATKT